jgi:hypothetical protein
VRITLNFTGKYDANADASAVAKQGGTDSPSRESVPVNDVEVVEEATHSSIIMMAKLVAEAGSLLGDSSSVKAVLVERSESFWEPWVYVLRLYRAFLWTETTR